MRPLAVPRRGEPMQPEIKIAISRKRLGQKISNLVQRLVLYQASLRSGQIRPDIACLPTGVKCSENGDLYRSAPGHDIQNRPTYVRSPTHCQPPLQISSQNLERCGRNL